MNKKTLFIGSVLTLVSAIARSEDNQNYANVKQISTWSGRADIVLDEAHKCTWEHTRVYVLKHSDDFAAHFSVLTAAMMGAGKVRLNYACDKDGKPIIYGVRTKPAQ